MNQPPCAEAVQEPDPPPLPARDIGIFAMWLVLALVIVVAVFDIWALKTKRRTISQMIQRLSRGWAWFRWIGLATMVLLTWHIFWGYPW